MAADVAWPGRLPAVVGWVLYAAVTGRNLKQRLTDPAPIAEAMRMDRRDLIFPTGGGYDSSHAGRICRHPTLSAATATAMLFISSPRCRRIRASVSCCRRNIVRTAVCLLFTLMGVAGLYFLLNAEFLAAVQLVVYAGGTLILIIFGVMLTSKSPFSRFEPRKIEVVDRDRRGDIDLSAALALAIRTGSAHRADRLRIRSTR